MVREGDLLVPFTKVQPVTQKSSSSNMSFSPPFKVIDVFYQKLRSECAKRLVLKRLVFSYFWRLVK